MKDILGFEGETAYLSNFYPCEIPVKLEVENGNLTKTYLFIFSSTEAAFQGFKVFRDIDHPTKSELEEFRKYTEYTPSKAKAMGRQKKPTFNVSYWNRIRNSVMERLLKIKFTHNKDLGEKLYKTGSVYLEETNTWGDKYWGVCNGEGENTLGKLLMKVRSDLNQGSGILEKSE